MNKLLLEWKLQDGWERAPGTAVTACQWAADAHNHSVGSSARLVIFYLLVYNTNSFIEEISLPGTEYSVTADWAHCLWKSNKIRGIR